MRTRPPPALRTGAAVLALVALVGLAGCGGGGGGGESPTDPAPSPPEEGEIVVELTTPNQDDGGILFTLSGASIDTVMSLEDGFASTAASGGVWTVLVTGELSDGPVAEVEVPDLEAAEANLEATIEQVAARESYEQRDLEGYGLELVPR